MRPRKIVYVLPAATANGICLSQTPSGTTPLTINGSLASGGIATLSSGDVTAVTGGCIQRRIRLTCAGNDTARTITVVGTITVDGNPQTITENMLGSNVSTTDSVNDYTTITSITPDGGAWAGAVTVGTNGVGATPWLRPDLDAPVPFAIGFGTSVFLGGTANWTVEHTFDILLPIGGTTAATNDPRKQTSTVPINFPHSSVAAKTSNTDGNYAFPVTGIRLKINSGAVNAAAAVTMQLIQAGVFGGTGGTVWG